MSRARTSPAGPRSRVTNAAGPRPSQVPWGLALAAAFVALPACKSRTFNAEAKSEPPAAGGQGCSSLEACLEVLDTEVVARRAECASQARGEWEGLERFTRESVGADLTTIPGFDVSHFHPALADPGRHPHVAGLQYALLRSAPALATEGNGDRDGLTERPFGPLKPQFRPQRGAIATLLAEGEAPASETWRLLEGLHARSVTPESKDSSPRLVVYIASGGPPAEDAQGAFRNTFESGKSNAPGAGESDRRENYLATRRLVESQILVGTRAGDRAVDAAGTVSVTLRDGVVPDAQRPKYGILGIAESESSMPPYSPYSTRIWRFDLTPELARRITLTIDDSMAKPEPCSRVPYRAWNAPDVGLALTRQLTLWARGRTGRMDRRKLDLKNASAGEKQLIDRLSDSYPGIKGIAGLKGNGEWLEAKRKATDAAVTLLDTPFDGGKAPSESATLTTLLREALQETPASLIRGAYLEAQVWGPLTLEDVTALVVPSNEKLSDAEAKRLAGAGIRVYRRRKQPGDALTRVDR